jgi:3-deoxy-D-manno-octulosonic-acid transferase
MWLLYQGVMGAALALAGPFLWWSRRRHYARSLAGRLGGGPAGSREPSLWIHAVSVGEVGVAATLVKALPAAVPVLLTTVTPTGQERARAILAGRADVAYLPFDLGIPLRRFFARHRPAALILVEGDYWPLALRFARRRGLPIQVINGRVSDRAFPRLHRLRRFLRPIFGPIGRFGVQTAADRERLEDLGVAADRVAVTGNLKFEIAPPPPRPEVVAWLAAARRGCPDRPLLVAGSTMRGEEDRVLDAWEASGRRHLPVFAPRHPERWDEVAQEFARRGLRVDRRSQADHDPADGRDAVPDVLLLDSLGELAGLYALADGAFVGGTLVPTGGHNPLEPAAHGTPVVAGPSMDNFREIAERFDAEAAWSRATNAAALAGVLRAWADDPAAARALGERGRSLIERHRGALGRTLVQIEPLVAAVVRSARREANR